MFKRTTSITTIALLGLAVALTGCGGGGNNGVNVGGGGAAGAHPDVAMLDAAGAPIMAGSTTPYSPRATCGACHDIDEVAEGYHFQQGRTDLDGNIIASADYFNDGRDFLQSAGMYGKW